jgi:hypothetical protein
MWKFNLVVLGLCLPALKALSWGALGHELVVEVSTELLTQKAPIFASNTKSLQELSTHPDRIWKSIPQSDQEKPYHFFHMDFYSFKFKNLGNLKLKDVLNALTPEELSFNGLALWRIQQLQAKAKQELRQNRIPEFLSWSGVLSHYIGDIAQPLHVTSNYDGQMTGQTGIHAWFESKNLNSSDRSYLKSRIKEFIVNESLEESESNQEKWVEFMKRSYEEVDPLLNIDSQYGRKTSENSLHLRQLAIQQMAIGAVQLAQTLNSIWQSSSNPKHSQRYLLVPPNWVALDEHSDFTSYEKGL